MSPFSCVVVLFYFYLARFVVVVSICFVCDSSIATICLSIPAARFVFRLSLIRFDFLVVRSCLSGEPMKNQGRGLVDRKLVQALLLLVVPRQPFCFVIW